VVEGRINWIVLNTFVSKNLGIGDRLDQTTADVGGSRTLASRSAKA